ncbi:hypothetical protein FACS1894159_07090 [Bacteroidia bacterium]|nr:hypothetical protein FACS1894159_07090 [Bacteroidia bacterium]
MEGSLPTGRLGLWKNGSLDLQTITTYKTDRERIADDRMVFSGIEEYDMPISLFLLGYTYTLGGLTLFTGLRNLNGDYFNTPYCEISANSGSGVATTLNRLSCANHPLFGDLRETALEVTWLCAINKYISLQPAWHHIRSGVERIDVGLMRVCCTIDLSTNAERR